MKKLLGLVLCASVVIGMSSCEQTENIFCYECTHPSLCDIEICDETASTTGGGLCVLIPSSTGSTNVEFKNAYEADGYTCRIK
jgi:hypothetical protein